MGFTKEQIEEIEQRINKTNKNQYVANWLMENDFASWSPNTLLAARTHPMTTRNQAHFYELC